MISEKRAFSGFFFAISAYLTHRLFQHRTAPKLVN